MDASKNAYLARMNGGANEDAGLARTRLHLEVHKEVAYRDLSISHPNFPKHITTPTTPHHRRILGASLALRSRSLDRREDG